MIRLKKMSPLMEFFVVGVTVTAAIITIIGLMMTGVPFDNKVDESLRIKRIALKALISAKWSQFDSKNEILHLMHGEEAIRHLSILKYIYGPDQFEAAVGEKFDNFENYVLSVCLKS